MLRKKAGERQIYYQSEYEEQNSKQRLGLFALQKQLQVLRLKEILVMAGFVSAAAFGRVLMQWLPSVEPLTFFAMLSGWLFGRKKGFAVGASSLYLSNFFVYGGQGPWTIFQALGFGIAGFAGGFLRKKATIFGCLIMAAIATLSFEIIVNFGSLVFLPSSIFTIFFLALPFSIVHLASNLAFSVFLPWLRRYVERTGRFNEKEICMELLHKMKNFRQNNPADKNLNIQKR